MSKYLYIVNPVSGKGKGSKLIPQISQYLISNKVDYTLLVTEYPTHATQLVKDNLSGFDNLISVGGDGTLNEVINGIDPHVFNKIYLGVLPVGTGNDFIKNINFSKDLIENLIILHNSTRCSREIDIIKIEYTTKNSDIRQTHLFANGAGIGFDAYVGALTQNNKHLSGVFAYIYSVVKALFNYKMINGDFIFNEQKISGNKLMITLGNGISHGGGFYLTPNAKIDDSLIDVSIFDQVSRRRLLSVLPKALVNKIETVPEAHLYKTKVVEIFLTTPYYLHCDGEIICKDLTHAEISIYKNKIKIIEKR